MHFCTDELRLKCKNRGTSCYMRQRHCGYSFHHFLFFFAFSTSFRLSFLLSLSLSSSADGFSLGLWRRLHSLLSDLHNCIDEQCLFNNVTGRFLTWHRKPLTFSEFQQIKDASTACIFIIPILCETDVYYDQLWQNVWYLNALLCFHLAEFFLYLFCPGLSYIIIE